FIRREIKEKGADWGELRRIKSHVVLKKGLPNIPDLVIKSDIGISYIVIMNWKRELRLYLFDSDGGMLHGQSYYQDFQELYQDFSSKSKKVARFPSVKKPPTRSQKDQNLDAKFKRVWTILAKKFNMSKKIQRNRPYIKGIEYQAHGIFGTKLERNFILIPEQSTKKSIIFTYYSLYFFLPQSIQENSDLAEALAFKFLTFFPKFKHEEISEERNSYEIMQKLNPWDSLKPSDGLKILKRVILYYDSPWQTQDFLYLVDQPLNLLTNLTRQKIPGLFCNLFSGYQNEDFLILANFLGLPFGFKCTIPSKFSNEELLELYEWLNCWYFAKVLPFMQKNRAKLTNGQNRAIKEALNFQYANVLKIELDSREAGKFVITNKSDSSIILTTATQIFPDGAEAEISFPNLIIKAHSKDSLNLRSLIGSIETPIRIRYEIVKSSKDISSPIFTGNFVV
ncbi:MAG: hypothetical protein ACXACR_10050, partial [Candidatus Hodarchaeales archaeon]